MEIKIVFTGGIPSKKNGRLNLSHTSLPSKEYSDWNRDWKSRIIKMYGGKAFFLEGCYLFYHFTFGSKRGKDISNAKESINDLLQDCGILNQDSYIDLKGGGDFSSYCKGVWECKVWIIDEDSALDNHPVMKAFNNMQQIIDSNF